MFTLILGVIIGAAATAYISGDGSSNNDNN